MPLNLKGVKEEKRKVVTNHFKKIFPNSELDEKAQLAHTKKNYDLAKVPKLKRTKKSSEDIVDKKTKKNIYIPSMDD